MVYTALYVSSTTSSGALTQLETPGPQNTYEDAAVVIARTFFREKVQLHTPCALAYSTLSFQNGVNFGTKLRADIPVDGDLLCKSWIVLGVSALSFTNNTRVGFPSQPVWQAYFTRLAPVGAMNLLEFKIGGTRIDVLDWLAALIAQDQAERPGVHYGRYLNDSRSTNGLIEMAQNQMLWFVPVRMFFWHPKQALPMIALRGHSIHMDVTFQSKSQLICISRFGAPFIEYPWTGTTTPGSGILLPTNVANPYAFPPALDSFGTDGINGAVLSGGDMLFAYVHAQFVYLGPRERRLFATRCHQYLISQWQMNADISLPSGTTTSKMQVSFNHIVYKLFIVGYCPSILANGHIAAWYNGNAGTSPIATDAVFFNNHERFTQAEFDWGNKIEAGEYSIRSARLLYAVVSLSAGSPLDVTGDSTQPNGGANFSMIDRTEIQVTVNPGPATTSGVTFSVRCQSRNVLICCRGMAGVKYAT